MRLFKSVEIWLDYFFLFNVYEWKICAYLIFIVIRILTNYHTFDLFEYDKDNVESQSVSFVFEAWTWTVFTIRSNALLRSDSNVLGRSALQLFAFPDRFKRFHESFRPLYGQKGSETVMKRPGTVNSQWTVIRWTVWNVGKSLSRSRFKNERNTVILYDYPKVLFFGMDQ